MARVVSLKAVNRDRRTKRTSIGASNNSRPNNKKKKKTWRVDRGQGL